MSGDLRANGLGRMVAGGLGAAILVLSACGRSAPAGGASADTKTSDASAKGTASKKQSAVADMGRGFKPYRGPVHVLPPDSLAVEFEPAQMDFGVVTPGGAATGSSRIWNVGSEPLRIAKSITSCGCTAAEDLAGRVIPPGGYTEFSTTMTMKSGLGRKKEKITVYFEGDPERVAIQYYTAEVSLPVRLMPPHIAASKRINDQWTHTTSGTLRVSSLDGQPFRIIRSHAAEPDFVGYDPAVDEPRSQYTIRWDLQRFQGGSVPWFWVLETDRPDCPVIDARVQHSSTLPYAPRGRMWVPKDQRLLVGLVRQSEPFEVTTKLEYVKGYVPDPSTAGVVSESPAFHAELLETQVDGQFLQYRIRLTPSRLATPGLFYGVVAVNASGFDTPLHLIGRVVEE